MRNWTCRTTYAYTDYYPIAFFNVLALLLTIETVYRIDVGIASWSYISGCYAPEVYCPSESKELGENDSDRCDKIL